MERRGLEHLRLDAVIAAGYPYELAGLIYYVFFLLMGRRRFTGRFSVRSRVLTLLAAIVLVACVPLHYATAAAGVVAMVALAVAALASSAFDALRGRRPV